MIPLDSGNFVNHWGGPVWTPYAEAIARRYSVIVPFYMTVPCVVDGAPQTRMFVTSPYQHDVLIFGAALGGFTTGATSDNGQQVFLNVTDLRTGISWATTGPLNAACLTAYGGTNQPAFEHRMPILKLPEAFFLPKNVRLQHLWVSPSLPGVAGGTLTWLGVQLINPCDKEFEDNCVTMPDGRQIQIGSRMPWLSMVGIGTDISTGVYYTLQDGEQALTYTPPIDCDVEIHDIAANFFQLAEVSTNPERILFTISDKGDRRLWQLNKAPAPALFGDTTRVYPALPLTKPYLLKEGHRLQVEALNLSGAGVVNPYVTFRGVRLCKF